MARYIVKRILQAIPLLLVISIICFGLIQMAPFDVIDTIATPDMAPEVREALKVKYGLDQPAHIQYLNWLRRMVTGNLGYSIVTHQSVAFDLAARLPNTVLLILPSYLLALAISIVLGLVAGSRRGGRADRIIDTLYSVGMATPTFWIAMMLLYVFGYKLSIFPILGMHTLGQDNSLPDLLMHLVLPTVVLTLGDLPGTVRFVRSSTISQYTEDYVMVQKAFGSSRAAILFRHVIKNVLLPVITLVGMSLPRLVTGAFITESIFSWPGVGTYFITAIRSFDYPVIMSVMFFSSVMVILGNLLADICYCLVDPRIQTMR
ncbi:MAG: ABC transporter permease [Clostridia bacterium]|nr:ABC transporter permease [Clostridia bacterium]